MLVPDGPNVYMAFCAADYCGVNRTLTVRCSYAVY